LSGARIANMERFGIIASCAIVERTIRTGSALTGNARKAGEVG